MAAIDHEIVQPDVDTRQGQSGKRLHAVNRVNRLDEHPDAAALAREADRGPDFLDAADHGQKDLVGAGGDGVLDLPLSRRTERIDPAQDLRSGRGAGVAQVFDALLVDFGVGVKLSVAFARPLPIDDDARRCPRRQLRELWRDLSKTGTVERIGPFVIADWNRTPPCAFSASYPSRIVRATAASLPLARTLVNQRPNPPL